jgi:cytochrome c oxidase cbb3-type subunit 2
MIRALASEVLRYGHYSSRRIGLRPPVPGGSKRTGPDLARIGGRYSDDWQRVHLANPRNVVPESIMPAIRG